jgi:hypothetical protein
MKRFAILVSMAKAKGGVAVLLLTLLVVLQSMAASPGFHQLVHPDAANSAHQCAVTMLASGQVACTDPTVSVISRPFTLLRTGRQVASDFISTDVLLHPSRGPPVVSVLLG